MTIQHKDVGGVTTQTARFVLSKCPRIVIPEMVQRSVGSVIEHKRWLSSIDGTSNFITREELLPIKDLSTPIRLPSLWTSSKFATRSLAGTEMCTAFDLPHWAIPQDKQVYSSFLDGIVPLKTHLAVMDQLLPFISTRGAHLGTTPLDLLPDEAHDSRGVWISHFKRDLGWLPVSWIDSSLVTDKAVKTDKASVPIHLWDKHICLPLQVDYKRAAKSLPVLRNWLYRDYR